MFAEKEKKLLTNAMKQAQKMANLTPLSVGKEDKAYLKAIMGRIETDTLTEAGKVFLAKNMQRAYISTRNRRLKKIVEKLTLEG